MADISSYPVINPKSEDLIIGSETYTVATPVIGNPTRNFTVSSIAALSNSINLGYTVYVESLRQTGTAAPVATVQQNTISGTITWSYTSTGKYKITLAGAIFPANRFVIFQNAAGANNLGAKQLNATNIEIDQFSADTGAAVDGMLSGTSIEIRIYPTNSTNV